jgi:hypothetical protein
MANMLKLRGEEFTLGDLTAATLEDFPDAIRDFFAATPTPGARAFAFPPEQIRALITLGAEAVRVGGRDGMTREEFRKLVQIPDLAPLYIGVGRALGLGRDGAEGAPGEAVRPEESFPRPETSSGA